MKKELGILFFTIVHKNKIRRMLFETMFTADESGNMRETAGYENSFNFYQRIMRLRIIFVIND
jgi:hypothetical protein